MKEGMMISFEGAHIVNNGTINGDVVNPVYHITGYEATDKLVEGLPLVDDSVAEPCVMPECFRSNRARGLFEIAKGEGLLDEDYKPVEGVPVWKLAFVADVIGRELCQQTKWKIFGEYWGYDKEYLRNSKKNAQDLNKEKEFSKKVLKKFI